jgi:hypothetical protein
MTRMWKDGFRNIWTIPAFPFKTKERKRSSSDEIWGVTEVYFHILFLWGMALFNVSNYQYFGITYALPPTSGYPQNNSIQSQVHHNDNPSGYLVPCNRFKTNPYSIWKSSSNCSSVTPVLPHYRLSEMKLIKFWANWHKDRFGILHLYRGGRDSEVVIATLYGLDVQNLKYGGARLCWPIHTGSETRPTSCTMEAGLISWG